MQKLGYYTTICNEKTWSNKTLVGGFHQFERYKSNGNLAQVEVNIKKMFELPPLRTAFRRKNTSPSSLLSNCRHWTNKKWVRPHSHVALTNKNTCSEENGNKNWGNSILNSWTLCKYGCISIWRCPKNHPTSLSYTPRKKKVTCFIINFIIIHHHQRHHNILSTSSTSSSSIINVITIRHCHLQTRWILVKCETMMVRWLGVFSLLQFLLEKTK